MSDVILINPVFRRKKSKYSSIVDGCIPSFGLGYLASYLENAGVDVCLIDANAEFLTDNEVIERIHKYSANHIGITAMTLQVNPALELAEKIKNEFPEVQISMGGVHATADPESLLSNSSIDYVFRGESDISFLKLLHMDDLSDIPGLSYKKENRLIHNLSGDFNRNLDSLPMPAYHLMPMALYRPSIGNYKQLPGMGIIASRGCPGKCTFCFVGTSGEQIRYRSPQAVFKQIVFLQEKYGIKEISFYDDNFTTSKNNVREFCELLLANNVEITWTCASRVDTVNRDLLVLMKKSGCHNISYGVETGDPQIMKNIRKGIDLDRAKQAIKCTEEVGIDAKVYLMVGHQGETAASLEKTYQFAMETDPTEIIVSIVTPYPGTELHRWANEHGYIHASSFDDYDLSKGSILELPTISSQEVSKFYKKLRLRFYLRPRFIFRRLLKIRSWHDLWRDFIALLSILGIIS